MLSQTGFLEDEKHCVLLRRNYGFFENSEIIKNYLKRAQNWKRTLKISENEIKVQEKALEELNLKDEKQPRILMADAERTFDKETNQNSLIKMTWKINEKYNDYQQNVTFVMSFLRLFLPAGEVLAIMHKIHDEETFLKDHFNAVAVGSKTDSILFMKLLKKHSKDQKAVEKLEKEQIPPDFLKKWFSGLCVHVLPFESLFEYIENFLSEGFIYCIKFGFCVISQLSEKIVSSKGIDSIMKLLELRPECFSNEKEFIDFSKNVIKASKTVKLDFLENFSLQKERKIVFEEEIQPMLDSAKKFEEENPAEEIPSCKLCQEGFQELFCKICKIEICEECHEAPNNDSRHLGEHSVDEIEEDYSEGSEEDKREETARKDLEGLNLE